MKVVLFIVYETAKSLVWLVRWFYYAKRTLLNRQWRKYKGPCILVSNHPGTLMDPMNAAVLMNRRVNFLANAGMFSTPFTNWFFSTFYCIKIERYLDTGGKPIDNKQAFKMAADYLTNDGCLYMAPEGGSFPGRTRHKFKTGPARIAFNTEEVNDFNLGLVILPIGLNYSNPGYFRSQLMSVMAKPIKVADFKDDWLKDQKEAVYKLTACIKERLEGVLAYAWNEEGDRLLAKIETILQNEEKLSGQRLLDRSKEALVNMEEWLASQQSVYERFKGQVDGYFEKLTQLKINDLSVKGQQSVSIFLMILGLPLFLLGYAIHFLPAYLIKLLSDKFATHEVWIPTIKIMGGLLIYPLVLWLQYQLIFHWLTNWGAAWSWMNWAYLLSIIPAGRVAEWFISKWQLLRSNWRFRLLGRQQPAEQAALLQLRTEILQLISK